MTSMNGRERRGDRKRKREDDDLSETVSSGGDSGVDLVDIDQSAAEATIESKLIETIESLTDKRSSTRLAALKTIFSALKSHYLQQFLLTRVETLKMNLIGIIRRKGSSQEVIVACRVLIAAVLTLGVGTASDDFYVSLFPIFEEYIKNAAKPQLARSAAVFALGMLCFVATSDPLECQKCMNLLSNIWKRGLNHPDTELVIQSLASWGLLASTLNTATIATACWTNDLPALSALLDAKELDVRTEAGENIALIYQSHTEHHAAQLVDDDGDVVVENKRETKHNQTDAIDVDALNRLLEQLATDGSRHSGARKERVKQRSVFRDIVRTVASGDVPSESLKILGQKCDFVGWAKLKQLNAIRQSLEGGVQMHFEQNDLLSDMFEIGVEAEPTGDKRLRKKADAAEHRSAERAMYLHKTKQRQRKVAAREED